ncbi:acrosin-binding protein [Dendropsophus ebraccatus]|uniref:acrosin-binding protein n=1 Tax=Dendropsophus ebraccatus TaxID=150705 RepID=UPI0038311494
MEVLGGLTSMVLCRQWSHRCTYIGRRARYRWLWQAFIILWWTRTWIPVDVTSPDPARPGSPLSEEEYQIFIKLIQPEWKAKRLCHIRRVSGCKDPQVFGYDLVENHGQIPKGPVCTELDTLHRFNSFCHFAMFRCTEERFYIKRIPCSSQPPPAQVFPYASSQVTQRRTIDKKNRVERPSSDLRSLTEKLLVYSFTVCDQQPIRRNQKNLPKSMAATKGPRRTEGPCTKTVGSHNEKGQVSGFDKEEQTGSVGSDFRPRKKYKAAVLVHVKGKNINLTEVSYHHHRENSATDNTTMPEQQNATNTSSRECN